MHALAGKKMNQQFTVNCYRAPGSDSVDTKQSMAVNRDNMTQAPTVSSIVRPLKCIQL